MTTPSRLIAILGIYAVAFLAWQSLGLMTSARTSNQTSRLTGDVQELWGGPMAQSDPDVQFHWTTTHETTTNDDQGHLYTHVITDDHLARLQPDTSELVAMVSLDQRLKGLVWYSLYNVTFDGRWKFTYRGELTTGDLRAFIKLPDPGAMYDDFRFEIDGVDFTRDLEATGPSRGRDIKIKPGQTIALHVHYKTRGMGVFSYDPENSTSLTHFDFQLTTDFDGIDYPSNATSPTHKERVGPGWVLDWTFAQVLSGKPMGVVTPSHIQPGELAADLSYSAPISLLLFFLVLLALGALRGLDIHPINYFAIAAAFFAFQLLFAYSVDHLPLWLAFTLSSAASVILVITYLRLVVDTRFALREAAVAQLVYQVGFALAHFWEGYTGLTVAVLATLTLFLVMQLTGRIKWGSVLARKTAVAT
jgi:hypothetical protein